MKYIITEEQHKRVNEITIFNGVMRVSPTYIDVLDIVIDDIGEKTYYKSVKQYVKKVLGYQNSLHLNIDEKIIANDKVYLIREFDSLLNQLNPNILYTPHHGDLHQDHRAVFEAVSSSSRVWSQNNIKQIFSYEIPSSSDQGYIRNFFPFIPTFYNPITQDHLIRKVEGMKCYSSEYSENPIHPRSEQALIEYAKKRGRE